MNERKTSFGKLLKCLLIVCLCLVMALGSAVGIIAATFDGDLDGDGVLTAFDAQLLAEYNAGERTELDLTDKVGLTVQGILDRILGKIIDEPNLDDGIEKTFTVTIDENNLTTEEQVITVGCVTATVPAGVLVTGEELTLSVVRMDTTTSDVTLEEGQELLPLDIHVEGVAEGNTTPIIICVAGALDTGLNFGNLYLYHVESGETVAMTQVTAAEEVDVHNEFYYDPTNGDITIAMASFSEITSVSEAAAWKGGVDHSWYDVEAKELTIANADQLWSFSQIVGGMAEGIAQDSFSGKVVNLVADINLGDVDPNKDYSEDKRVFYPIGYYNSEGTYVKSSAAITSGFYPFQGTFDGQGHTIGNFYQNTWEMKGDHNWYDATLQYYRDGMGLFGKVYGGTVKNLTVENFSSDGEIATTGVIAAYADCGATFENIAIFNCNPRVYNIGNGGIVGCVGWYANDAHETPVTFKNITVDNTNKISALWGSWDVACGGLVGQYYPTSGQTNAIDNAGISMVNCHVAAQIDVNNDVCANYQYYAYRYAGILIGSVRENVTGDNGYVYPNMDDIKATDCTVHFGTWNDYYYCELVANTTASYTHDYQMSRLTEVTSVDVVNMKVTDLKGNTTSIPTSGTYNYVVVDYTKGHGTENATCYHFVNGVQHQHETSGKETIDGVEVLVEDKQHLYLEFNNLVTGYGWGVTSKGIGDLTGVTILDRLEGSSEPKFEAKTDVTVENGITYNVGDLFAAVTNPAEPINAASLQVSVNDMSDGDGVITTGTFVRDLTDWTKSTLTIHGAGAVAVTIQDYYYCEPTTINLTVSAHIHCLCGALTTLNPGVTCDTCGQIATIWEPTAAMPTSGSTGHYFLTGDVEKEGYPTYTGDVAVCLAGHDVVTVAGTETRFLAADSGANVSIADCAETQGEISGSQVAAVRIHAGATFNLYGGIITDNHNNSYAGSGIVYLNVGSEDQIARFNMYGGQITGNTVNMRGAVFTAIPDAEGEVPGEIRILGGSITKNTSYAKRASQPYTPSNAVSGGAGIYAFGPVYVGGSAVIADNECKLENSSYNDNILLRTAAENELYSGQLIVQKALTSNTDINYGTRQKDNTDDLQALVVRDTNAITNETIVDGVLYEGNVVYVDGNSNYYTEHIHCLCGDTTIENTTCPNCNSVAKQWTGINAVAEMTATGYYYLQKDESLSADLNSKVEQHLCLNGHNLDMGEYQWNVDSANVTLSDCMAATAYSSTYSAGKIAGVQNAHAAIKLISDDTTGATFAMYDGMVTGNTNTSNTGGIIWLEDTTNKSAKNKFYMYGGEISGNTVFRGTIMTEVSTDSASSWAGEIYILGGSITGNTGTGTEGLAGGAGIYSFGPVTVGGNAYIYGNTATGKNNDIWLRNGTNYEGKLIVSAAVPLQEGAKINYGTDIADTGANMTYISGTPATWDPTWISYNGEVVSYDATNKIFYTGHIHCLCGKTIVSTCSECSKDAVEWTAWTSTNSLPTEPGYYYLTSDIVVTYATGATQATVITNGANVAIDLCGHSIYNENGDRLVWIQNGTLTITDCQGTGAISGFGKGDDDTPIQVGAKATFNLYGGIITGNTGDHGIICLPRTEAGEAFFNMYGGEISNNTVTHRGIVCADYTSNDNHLYGTIKLLGGKITGNTCTNTNNLVAAGAVYAFGPVYVGGDVQISGNTAASNRNSSIMLRNDMNGELILDSDHPLTSNAKVDFGVSTTSSAMSCISFSDETYELPSGVLTYNGKVVSYADGVFTYAEA